MGKDHTNEVKILREELIEGLCYLMNSWTGQNNPSYLAARYVDKKLLPRVDAHYQARYIGLLPEEKHHIESDRNIAYREGWNDCIDTAIKRFEEK